MSSIEQANIKRFGAIRDLIRTNSSDFVRNLSEKFKLIRPDGSLKYEIKKASELTFFTDPEKPQLEPGEMAVYPFFDEGIQLSRIVSGVVTERGKKFNVTIDPFCGGGHSGLPMLGNDLTERVILSDLNPRATNLARANAELNGLGKRTAIVERDIVKDGLSDSDYPGNTLYIANPPFALKAKGANMETMRDGGPNGLTLTMSFASQAVEKAKTGDVIVGVAYSRIGENGKVELTEKLKKLIDVHGGDLEVSLIEGESLWRGFNGKKEQPNPMPINEDIFALKADPAKSEEVEAYRTAAQFHNNEGYTHLGYFSYIIRK